MFDLTAKVALVTGGSRGIGRAVAVTLAAAGARVLVNYRSNEAAAKGTLAEITRAGGKGGLLQFDVSDPDAAAEAIKKATSEHGRIDILVNNAGLSIDQLLMRVSPEDLATTWATNINGAFYCAKACIRPMMRNKWGRVINLSSVAAEAGNPGQAVYSASKAALIGLTKTLAREYGSRGITVNAIAPGFVETDMTSSLSEALVARMVEQTPVGRVGRPEEVAAAALFLASEEAAYVTGQVLRVNGGMYV